jgi:hypothetical protein
VYILSNYTARYPADLSWPHPQNNHLDYEDGGNISLLNLDIYVQCNEMSQSRKTRPDCFVNCSEVQKIRSRFFLLPLLNFTFIPSLSSCFLFTGYRCNQQFIVQSTVFNTL